LLSLNILVENALSVNNSIHLHPPRVLYERKFKKFWLLPYCARPLVSRMRFLVVTCEYAMSFLRFFLCQLSAAFIKFFQITITI
jgi:hypothetical protein